VTAVRLARLEGSDPEMPMLVRFLHAIQKTKKVAQQS
jgi:hypothetical protein